MWEYKLTISLLFCLQPQTAHGKFNHQQGAAHKQGKQKMTQKLTNTEILLFICGYQGGTVHQLASSLGTTADDILNADYDKMQSLMRQAQKYRNGHLVKEIPVFIPFQAFEEITTTD
jgi:hypothetical protein